MFLFPRNHLKILVFFLALTLACQVFTPEYEEQLRQEATETNQANQIAPEPTVAQETPVPQETAAPTATVELTVAEQAALTEQVCVWVQLEPTEALATGDGTPGMSAQRDGDWIGTSYTHAGDFGCDEQTLITSHTWYGLDEEFYPGREYILSVELTWRLEGSPECTSLTAGAKTSLVQGTTTIEISQSTIKLSSEPDGYLSTYGPWTAPKGAKDGDTFKITAHASSGSLGGTVFYSYEYICSSP